MKRMSVTEFTAIFSVSIPSAESCKCKDRITSNQKFELHDAGLNVSGLLKSQATVILKEIHRRERLGLCSPKAVLLIKEVGVKPRTPYRCMSSKHAFQLISRKMKSW